MGTGRDEFIFSCFISSRYVCTRVLRVRKRTYNSALATGPVGEQIDGCIHMLEIRARSFEMQGVCRAIYNGVLLSKVIGEG
jgi:hypothetical protein